MNESVEWLFYCSEEDMLRVVMQKKHAACKDTDRKEEGGRTIEKDGRNEVRRQRRPSSSLQGRQPNGSFWPIQPPISMLHSARASSHEGAKERSPSRPGRHASDR